MTHCSALRRAWRAAVSAAGSLLLPALAALATLTAGCASVAPPPPAAPLLHDSLFGDPPRPAGADAVLALSPAMLDHVQQLRRQVLRPAELPQALAESLYSRGGLQLDYDASSTRNAAEAYAARSGNCLSLVVMTTAFARALGLELSYQEVPGAEQFRHEGDLTLRSGHVNVVLGPRPLSQGWRLLGGEPPRHTLVIDFLPQAGARALPSQPIEQARVLAMFMNNRAVEALLARDLQGAYAWVREALRSDPGFAAAFNTLGVVYQRGGHLVAATAAYRHGLLLDERQPGTMANLAQVLVAQGRADEAALWEARRVALEPQPPLHQLRLGQAALAAGDWTAARRHFQQELRQQPDAHEAWFGLARVHAALGDGAQAAAALRRAMEASATGSERARYAGKLDALRGLLAQ